MEAGAKSASGREAVLSWVNLLNGETDSWLEVLCREDSLKLLARSQMDQLLELVEVLPSGPDGSSQVCASEQVGLSQDRVGGILSNFYSTLFSNNSSPFDGTRSDLHISSPIRQSYERISSSKIRNQARDMVSEKVAQSYELVYNMVANEFNKYDRNILTHTIDEVRVLLQCSK